MLVLTRRRMEAIRIGNDIVVKVIHTGTGTVKLGVTSGLSVGTFGEGGTAGLDVVSITWSKGAFLGMSLEGFSISASPGSNETYYGRAVEPEQILANGPITNPGADELRAALDRATR